MKQLDAKREVFKIWDNWLNKTEKYSNMAGLLVHSSLQKDHSDLLSFKSSGDKYQIINIWVMEWQKSHPVDR